MSTFYLILVAILWASNMYGFGTDSIRRLSNGPAFAAIVHAHAIAFVGWQVVLTIQLLLARSGRLDLHRRLGTAATGLAIVMVPLGIATAWTVDAAKLSSAAFPPAFLFLQIADMALFALLAGWGIAARREPAAHKRLMMLTLVNLSTAGSGRWAHAPIATVTGNSFAGEFVAGNLPVLVMIAAMIAFDWWREGRPQPVWRVALPLIFAVELFQTWVVASPGANALARSLLS